jgi:hypothetical protein
VTKAEVPGLGDPGPAQPEEGRGHPAGAPRVLHLRPPVPGAGQAPRPLHGPRRQDQGHVHPLGRAQARLRHIYGLALCDGRGGAVA